MASQKAGTLYQVDYDRNSDDASKWERVNFALRRISATLDQQSAAGGTGGVTDHSKLTNLGYASSGHIGFAPTAHVHAEDDVTNLVTDLAAKAPSSRSINTTAPLSGGGDLSVDRTLSIPKATAAGDGYLDHGDFGTFNGKQAALGYTPEDVAHKGAVSGYAPLDSAQKVPTTNLGGAGADATKFLRGDQTWAAPSSAPAPVRPSYSACTIYWDIPSGLPFANLGTGGTLALPVYSNAVVTLKNGIYGKCASLDLIATDNKGFLRTGNTSVGESNSISVALWVKLVYRNDYAVFIGKNYYLNDTASSPYFAWNIRTNNVVNSSSAQWFAEVVTDGSVRNVTPPYYNDYIPYHQWTHLGFTYDAATGDLSVYKDGELRATVNYGVYPIQYGTHGSYVVGADYQFTPRQDPGRYEDIRIYDTVLSAADMLALYTAGALANVGR